MKQCTLPPKHIQISPHKTPFGSLSMLSVTCIIDIQNTIVFEDR
jgi:hypothetical protein